jgi:hypothetical protein
MTGKAQINHPAVGNPVVRANPGNGNDKKNCSPKKDEAQPGAPITPADSNTQGISPFRREKNRPSLLRPRSPT